MTYAFGSVIHNARFAAVANTPDRTPASSITSLMRGAGPLVSWAR